MPIFKIMELYSGFVLSTQFDEAYVQSSYEAATGYSKSRVSCVWRWTKDDRILSVYAIGTWSKYFQRSEIEKHGTVKDKSHLTQATASNQADKMKWGFTLVGDARSDGMIPLNMVAWATHWHNQER